MTHPEMAAALREEGWSVREPVSKAIPEPKAGQVWASAEPGVEARTVVKIGLVLARRSFPYVINFVSEKHSMNSKWGHDGWAFPEDWRAWARRTGARPVPA